jgi:O-acetyl-ADP-ribose deacetylase (regulator of RNase III)
MKTIKGDLIKLAEEGKFDIIVHGCNCFHAMGAGIARQLADKYPQVEDADFQTPWGDRNKLGKCSIATVELDNHRFYVVNAYTQYKWSSGSDVFEYDSFNTLLNRLISFATIETQGTKRINRIGFPMIGAGLAGGDWSRISKMIEQFAEDVKSFARVTVVEYQK